MAIVAVASGAQAAAINTEHALALQTGVGIYVLMVDTSAMQADDSLTLRIKTKRAAGDTARIAYAYTHNDVQQEPNKYSVPVPSDTEISFTLLQTAGTGRTYPWKVLRA